ncbi:acyl-homoserine-lactone synthase [Tepidicaulis sp. LMO-SS28]|uniref:acyl-homoserine-lactone synthase n=1 Tax=Tepidicaulis sp. LMO-SS28 TaxID=3447455 RepID=UPI003EE41ADA
MLDYVTRGLHLIPGSPLDEYHQLRYKLYIEQEGWDVPHIDGREYDEFDTPKASYLLCRDDETGRVIGGVRILRTTDPYMLKDIWPDMLDIPAPEAGDIWEGSRFHADPGLAPEDRRKALQELSAGLYELTYRFGVNKLFFVMPPRLAKSWFDSGLPFEMLGSEKHFNTGPAVAGWLLCTQEARELTHAFFGGTPDIHGLEEALAAAA